MRLIAALAAWLAVSGFCQAGPARLAALDLFHLATALPAASQPAGPENLAAGKPATQSSTLQNASRWAASNGVDSTRSDSSLFHTALENRPWWEVDLLAVYPIDHLMLYNRQQHNPERARSLEVLLSEDGSNYQLIYAHDGQVFRSLQVPAGGLRARYLRVRLNAREYLHLQEVMVYRYGDVQPASSPVRPLRTERIERASATTPAPAAPKPATAAPAAPKPATASPSAPQSAGPGNLAAGKPAMQSSTLQNASRWAASNGVDSTRSDSSLFHTALENRPWWEVDLLAVYPIDHLMLYNRQQHNPERARSLEVLLSEDGSNYQLIYAHDGQVFRSLQVPTGGLRARYVRVRLNAREYLHLQEVMVYRYGDVQPASSPVRPLRTERIERASAATPAPAAPKPATAVPTAPKPATAVPAEPQSAGPGNLAAGRPAMQSSTFQNASRWAASNGVDSARSDSSLFHTALENRPWWEVDLLAVYPIDHLMLYNRQQHNPERARSIEVLLSEDGSNYQLIYAHNGQIFRSLQVQAGGLRARYVRIRLNAREYLHLQEVMVYRYGDVQPASSPVRPLRTERIERTSAATPAPAAPKPATQADRNGYPSIQGIWYDTDSHHRIEIKQQSGSFVATHTRRTDYGHVFSWRMEGSLSRDGRLSGLLQYTEGLRPSDSGYTQSYSMTLSPNGEELVGHTELPHAGGGGGRVVWRRLSGAAQP